MTTLYGAATLVRFVLRRDRFRLIAWIGGIVAVVLASAAGLPDVYPDDAAIQAYVELSRNPAIVAFAGPGYGFGDPSIGAVLVNEVELYGGIAMALMSLFLIVRHTRAEEDSERVELVRSNAVGRHAPTAAAIAVVGAANLVIGLGAAIGFVAIGYGPVGSFTLAGSLTAVGLVFVGVAAVAAEVAGNARSALALGGVVLGTAFVLRAIGDVGDNAWRWASPIGWAQSSRAFADERWWPLLMALAAGVALVVAAFWLSTRRDLGAGIVAVRPGPPVAAGWSASPFGFAIKLQWGAVAAWTTALFVLAVVFGAIAEDVETIVEASPAIEEVLLGAGGADVVDTYLATAITMLGSIAAGFAVASASRLHTEEAAGRAESLLATAISRRRWVASHVLVAGAGTALVLAAAGAGLGTTRAVASGDAGELSRLTGSALASAPAVWVLAAVAVALFGLVPRASLAGWGVLAVVWIVVFFGELLDLPGWARNVSPFEHLALVPVEDPAAGPLVALTALAAALALAGLWGFGRRDLRAA